MTFDDLEPRPQRGAALAAPTDHSPLLFWTISSETAFGTSA